MRQGGVYQIALFADRLVDALLSDDRVAVPVDGSKRNESSLKYLVTEVLCKVSGGPEVITCPEAQETSDGAAGGWAGRRGAGRW